MAGDHSGSVCDSWRERDHHCPQSHQNLYHTHFLIPAPLSSSFIISSSSSMLLIHISSTWLLKVFSSRRSSCEQVHSLSQLPRDVTWSSPGKSLEGDPQRDAASGCQVLGMS